MLEPNSETPSFQELLKFSDLMEAFLESGKPFFQLKTDINSAKSFLAFAECWSSTEFSNTYSTMAMKTPFESNESYGEKLIQNLESEYQASIKKVEKELEGVEDFTLDWTPERKYEGALPENEKVTPQEIDFQNFIHCFKSFSEAHPYFASIFIPILAPKDTVSEAKSKAWIKELKQSNLLSQKSQVRIIYFKMTDDLEALQQEYNAGIPEQKIDDTFCASYWLDDLSAAKHLARMKHDGSPISEIRLNKLELGTAKNLQEVKLYKEQLLNVCQKNDFAMQACASLMIAAAMQTQFKDIAGARQTYQECIETASELTKKDFDPDKWVSKEQFEIEKSSSRTIAVQAYFGLAALDLSETNFKSASEHYQVAFKLDPVAISIKFDAARMAAYCENELKHYPNGHVWARHCLDVLETVEPPDREQFFTDDIYKQLVRYRNLVFEDVPIRETLLRLQTIIGKETLTQLKKAVHPL